MPYTPSRTPYTCPKCGAVSQISVDIFPHSCLACGQPVTEEFAEHIIHLMAQELAARDAELEVQAHRHGYNRPLYWIITACLLVWAIVFFGQLLGIIH